MAAMPCLHAPCERHPTVSYSCTLSCHLMHALTFPPAKCRPASRSSHVHVSQSDLRSGCRLQSRLVLSRSLTHRRDGPRALPVSRCHWMGGRACKVAFACGLSSPAAGHADRNLRNSLPPSTGIGLDCGHPPEDMACVCYARRRLAEHAGGRPEVSVAAGLLLLWMTTSG